jgi:hypothetical protein
MLTIEMAIQKIQHFPPEQRNQVIQFIEFLDFKSNQIVAPETQVDESEQAFFELAGLWENKEITLESIRAEAWREGK